MYMLESIVEASKILLFLIMLLYSRQPRWGYSLRDYAGLFSYQLFSYQLVSFPEVHKRPFRYPLGIWQPYFSCTFVAFVGGGEEWELFRPISNLKAFSKKKKTTTPFLVPCYYLLALYVDSKVEMGAEGFRERTPPLQS